MTQKEKDLLFIELSARLHYGVKVQTPLFESSTSIKGIAEDECWIYSDEDNYEWINIEEVKPYLRPMSSMTEEEENKYNSLNAYEKGIFPHTEEAFDWLLANHFDFRGLIEKSLALSAPEGMYEEK